MNNNSVVDIVLIMSRIIFLARNDSYLLILNSFIVYEDILINS